MGKASKQESYLISAALILSAILILYNVFSAPDLSPPIIANAQVQTSGVQISSYSYSESPTVSDFDGHSESDLPAETQPGGSAATAPSTPGTSAVQTTPIPATAPKTQAPKPTFPINVNTASSLELQNIPGIGPVKADAIVAYRKENGRFNSVNDLVKVKGIGDKTLSNMRKYVTV